MAKRGHYQGLVERDAVRANQALHQQYKSSGAILEGRVACLGKACRYVARRINHAFSATDTDRHADLSLSQVMDIFKLLTSTYPRYVDAESREAVESVGVALVRRDELRGTPQGEPGSILGVTEQVLGWMSQEVGRIQKRSR